MIEQDTYAGKPLGKFIESTIIKDLTLKKRKGSYAGDSGTVSEKVKFCERAIEAMKEFKKLSPAAKDLTQKVYDFIKSAQHS